MITGSYCGGVFVPFPQIDRLAGEPVRLRLGPGGVLKEYTVIPSKWVNFSLNGEKNVLLPSQTIKTSTIPGAGFGSFANEDLEKHRIVAEYGGRLRSLEKVEEMVVLKQHTHLNAIYTDMLYIDSRWHNGDTPHDAEIPGVREYLEAHYTGGFINAAYYQVVDCDTLENA